MQQARNGRAAARQRERGRRHVHIGPAHRCPLPLPACPPAPPAGHHAVRAHHHPFLHPGGGPDHPDHAARRVLHPPGAQQQRDTRDALPPRRICPTPVPSRLTPPHRLLPRPPQPLPTHSQGSVNTPIRRWLSGRAFNLLLPAVVFVNIAGQVTAENIASYWPFAMNTAIRWVLAGVSERGREGGG